jgi:outer membrane autotransporter protein
MGIVQGMWHTLADSWIDRASDLRTIYGSTGGAGADLTYEAPVSVPTVHSGNSGIWGRVIGQIANRDVSYETEPFPYQYVTVDADYEEHLGAIQGGIDHAFDHGNGTTVVGLLAGYAHNSVDFIDAGDTAKITAPHVGAYVNWLNGGTYVDAMVKADFLTVDFNVAGEEATTKGHSLGARLEAGHRSQMGHVFVEPVAAIAYVRTQLDPVTIGMTDVIFEDGQSLRGKIGGRVGFTSMSNGMQIDPYVHAYVGSEFLGENTVFFDSGPGLTVIDDVSGIFGEVGGGFNVTTEDKHPSFYGQANYIFADGYHAGNATVGARVNW